MSSHSPAGISNFITVMYYRSSTLRDSNIYFNCAIQWVHTAGLTSLYTTTSDSARNVSRSRGRLAFICFHYCSPALANILALRNASSAYMVRLRPNLTATLRHKIVVIILVQHKQFRATSKYKLCLAALLAVSWSYVC